MQLVLLTVCSVLDATNGLCECFDCFGSIFSETHVSVGDGKCKFCIPGHNGRECTHVLASYLPIKGKLSDVGGIISADISINTVKDSNMVMPKPIWNVKFKTIW